MGASGAVGTAQPTPFTPTPLPVNSYRQGVVTSAPLPRFPTFDNTNIGAFTFGGGTNFLLNGQAIPGDGLVFAPNPVYPGSYARTDAAGMIYYRTPQGEEGYYTFDPFFEGFYVARAEENKNYVNAITWAPNGERFAFIVEPPPGTDTVGAGVYFWQPGGGYRLLYDCPQMGYSSCDLMNNPLPQHQSHKLEWSPDSQRVLVSLDLTTQNRGGIVVVQALPIDSYDDNAPPILGYDAASWLDADTLLVSGRRHSDARVIIGTINYPFGNYDALDEARLNERILYDGSDNNIWVQDAVQRSNGQIVTLCKRGLANGGPDNRPLRLCALRDGTLIELTQDIGPAMPEAVSWSADRGLVVLRIAGQQYSVAVDAASITRVTAGGTINLGSTQIGGAGAGGSGGVAPVGVRDAQAASNPVPDGVVAGSRYRPGQQVQYVGLAARNLRDQPNLTTSRVIGFVAPEEFVAILAGPYQSDAYGWWRVSTARDQRGWLAADEPTGSLFNP